MHSACASLHLLHVLLGGTGGAMACCQYYIPKDIFTGLLCLCSIRLVASPLSAFCCVNGSSLRSAQLEIDVEVVRVFVQSLCLYGLAYQSPRVPKNQSPWYKPTPTRALIVRTPTKRTPNCGNSHLAIWPVVDAPGVAQSAPFGAPSMVSPTCNILSHVNIRILQTMASGIRM